jgi:Winged helix DNA-binding domain
MIFECMTPNDIANLRLINQQIAQPVYTTPAEVVAAMGAMQAQDYTGALWSIGLRLPHATEADIEQAIAERTIVRTWPMRGTLHVVAAADVRWMLALLTPRIVAGSAGRHKQLGLDDATFARSQKVLAKALQGGQQLARDEAMALLDRNGISTVGQRGYHILGRLAHDSVICFGSRTGKQHTFVLLDEWVPAARKLERDEALAELARRYFIGHGPASLQDFAWWSGLKISDARAGLAMAAPHLVQVAVEGKDYWMRADAPEPGRAAPSTFLLPGFDEFLLGYTDRSAALQPQHAQKIIPGGNGVFMPTLVVNGRVAGTWKRAVQKKAVTIELSPFAALKKTEMQAIAVVAQRYGQFLGLPVQLS